MAAVGVPMAEICNFALFFPLFAQHPDGGMDDPYEASEAGCGSAARSLASGVPGPIFFLIKEQAKSLLAIKELQDRVHALEGFRNDIFFAVQDIQQTMESSSDRPPQVRLLSSIKEPSKPVSECRGETRAPSGGPESKSWTVNAKPRRHKDETLMTTVCGRARAKGAGVGSGEPGQGVVAKPTTVASLSSKGDTASAILESDKQDSGLDSDCREHGSRESTLAPKDELLSLLDIIDERSVQLKERVRQMEKATGWDSARQGSRSEVLEFHEKELQARLNQIEVERTKHRMVVRQLQATIHRMEGEKIACEEKLQASLSERKELEKKVHSLHMQYVRGGPSSLPLAKPEASGAWPSTSLHSLGAQKLAGECAQGITSEEGKAKVSTILKESSPLELKKLLLLYTLENQALREKANEVEQHWFTKLSEWKASEASLRTDIKNLIQQREEYLHALRRYQRDMAVLQAKYKELEMTVWALDNPEDQRAYRRGEDLPPGGNRFLCPAEPGSSRSCYGNVSCKDSSSKAQSLPPMLLNQAKNTPLLSRRGAYATEFRRNSLAENSLEEAGFSNEDMAYELVDPRHQKPTAFSESQVPQTQKTFWQDRRLGAAVMPSEAVRLMNLEDDREEGAKSGPQSNIEMICNEFDPLSEAERQCASKPLDFEDSLDLSIPLKPIRVSAVNASKPSRSSVNMNYLTPASGSSKITLDQHRTFGKSKN
ncbi:hypothetical protein V5799_013683 [Amblyomma americanum]|uniref:Uncharacterized protein n=1 Tax=Amblyomma americanum TaxID=6943 RepID=A0AAQ4E5D0_AMBAM